MRILILGCDGFTGYPITIHLLKKGHVIYGIDSFLRRNLVNRQDSQSIIPIEQSSNRWEALKELGDFQFSRLDIAKDYEDLRRVIEKFQPESIINLAQQPSAAFSMKDVESARLTQENNTSGLLNLMWAIRHTGNKEVPIVHLGTMGEYGQSVDMPIPEGFFQAEHEGYNDVLPFPRQAGSIYHNSKVQMSDLAWFACRIWELRDTDIHQGVIFGTRAPDKLAGKYRTRLDQDECFGTVVNRFIACAAKGLPLPVYGSGFQKRAMLSLRDAVRCTTLAVENPPTDEDSFHSYRVINQFTDSYSVKEVAEMVQRIGNQEYGLDIEIRHIPNPRVEEEVHFYEPESEKLERMGFEPSTTLEDEINLAFEDVLPHRDRIIEDIIHPKIKWR